MHPVPLKRLLYRTPAIVLVVLLVNVLPFGWLQEGVAAACVALCGLVGLEVVRLSSDVIALPGWPMEIAVACTMIDYYVGFGVFVWPGPKRWRPFLRLMVVFFPLLMGLNLVRLLFGFWLFTEGVTWPIAHEVVMGLVYFGLTEWAFHIVRQSDDSQVQVQSEVS